MFEKYAANIRRILYPTCFVPICGSRHWLPIWFVFLLDSLFQLRFPLEQSLLVIQKLRQLLFHILQLLLNLPELSTGIWNIQKNKLYPEQEAIAPSHLKITCQTLKWSLYYVSYRILHKGLILNKRSKDLGALLDSCS